MQMYKSLSFALGAVCVILLLAIAGVIMNYNSIISEKERAYDNYVAAHGHTNSDYDALNASYRNYVATHSYNNSEYADLYNGYVALKVPRLIRAWNVEDKRPVNGTFYLFLHGYACNVGTDTAFNCRLHVSAWQSAVVAIDAYVDLGAIAGESRSTHVNSSFAYVGSNLTFWVVTPLWTATP